jgi:SNF2 family DNA or RNA helicase
MIVLHAAFCDGEMLLWGESPEDPAQPKNKRRTRATKPSPFDSGAAKLAKATAAIGVPVDPASDTREVVLWAPTAKTKVFPSSAMVAEVDADPDQAKITPWKVTALPLDSGTCQLLLAITGSRRRQSSNFLSPGVIIGDDLAYWADALWYTAGLVIRQQFLPDLVPEDGYFRALWRPVIVGPDGEKMYALASAMPAVARAVTRTDEVPPDWAPDEVLLDFITENVDALVRSPDDPGRQRPMHTLHDRWLQLLRYGNGRIQTDDPKIQELIGQVQEWRRPVQVSADSPFRLCFRLEEPTGDEEQWVVRYMLQSTRDPSLLVPAHDVWHGNKHGPLARQAPALRETLLISLGQAASIFPKIENSLRKKTPAKFLLDTRGAHDFLSDVAISLEQSGFGVVLPEWWRKAKESPLAIRANVESSGEPGSISLDSLVKFHWEMAIGDDALSIAELDELAKLRVPLAKIRGKWVQVNTGQVQAASAFLKRKGNEVASLGDLLRIALGAESQGGGPLKFSGVAASGWVGDFLNRLQGKDTTFEDLPPPNGLDGTLRPYQVKGYSWLAFLRQWRLGACLADDMGLGKTIQMLAAVQRAIEHGEKRPFLLICPTSVVGNWQKEAQRFTPGLKLMVHHGQSRLRGGEFQQQAKAHNIVLSSYSLLYRDFDALRDVDWAGIVLDEAQNIKNPDTKQAGAARALTADCRVALTGTPVENNVGDLWSIMEFLNPGLLGTHADFKRKYFLPIQLYGDHGATDRLRKLTHPFVLRRVKTDKNVIADLPDKFEMKVFCTLTREQAQLYEAVVKEAEAQLSTTSGMERRGIVLATLMRLKQVCNHPAQLNKDVDKGVAGRSGKLTRITEMLEEVLGVGDRCLIFTQFTEMGDILKGHLEMSFGREVLYLHGGVAKKNRDRMIERFSKADGPPIFLLSLKAGGTGLNLTNATHVFHFDRWWNPAVENQATDRAFRIGQTRNVQVHKFVCVGTLEEKIDEMIDKKKDIAGKIVGGGEQWITEMSNEELKEIFALRSEAIGE